MRASRTASAMYPELARRQRSIEESELRAKQPERSTVPEWAKSPNDPMWSEPRRVERAYIDRFLSKAGLRRK